MKRRTWLAALALAGCGRKGPSAEEFGPPKKTYPLRGVVLRLKPADRVAVIQHEKIGDWMEAMTMEFRVPSETDFAKLKEGARVEATVFTNDLYFWIGDVR
jgi:Cu/Ag efflux protein CusF